MRKRFEFLNGGEPLKKAGVGAKELAVEVETLLSRFPTAGANPDERRRLRAALYRPLLSLPLEERLKVVDNIFSILFGD